MSNDTVGIWLTVPEGEKERAQPIVRDLLRVTASKLKVFPQHGDEMRLLDALADSARLVKLEDGSEDDGLEAAIAKRIDGRRRFSNMHESGIYARAALAALKERLGVK